MFMEFDHGGEIERAAQAYGIPPDQWLDLSTGINPHAWPVPEVPAQVWQRLPEEDVLLVRASRYYGAPVENLVAVPGSQAALSTLPRLLERGAVMIPAPTFSEHAEAWHNAGHEVIRCAPDAALVHQALIEHTDCRYLVVVSPNNPTGERYSLVTIELWRRLLEQRGGLLLVDEAFMDATPQHSAITAHPKPGLVILRSIGKFFGLAGLRLGFALAPLPLAAQLKAALGPWCVSHPARFIGAQLLADTQWQLQTRNELTLHAQRLAALLNAWLAQTPGHTVDTVSGCCMFQSFHWPHRAQALFHQLAQQGILIRYFPNSDWLRVGLPSDENAWQRLEQELYNFTRHCT
jgi:cobalamin biosynthetic protein CobC